MKTKFLIPALALIMFSACQKKTDCGASVTVNDQNGLPLKGVDVRLFANVKMEPDKGTVTADLKANGITDQSGKAVFNFKLPAIYDIQAISGTYTTTGIIKLEEGKIVNKNLEIKQ